MMEQKVKLYNSLSRQKEDFQPLNPPLVGLYVCGPTVYGDAHLGHSRPAITFDLIFRYLTHLGYKVRYVRNITDVGHLENDADSGEDKIGKKARLEKVEPMEIVQYYSDRYHENMDALNVRRPSIEPRASGHIIEQIKMIQEIMDHGFAYEVNGSVYFDVVKYNQENNYGKLSGRVIDDLIANTRELEGQQEKRNSLDFALWKKAAPEHIMRWPSPWSEGFPGWHIECSAMSSKYLGEQFDIHGGGMDLLFPHHECEIAQSVASHGVEPAKYWVHCNVLTINGQKMGKSLGNFITLEELFTGNHKALEQAYSPMTVRFFMLQAHYRSTLDFSNSALQAAEKGLSRLMQAYQLLEKIEVSASAKVSSFDVKAWKESCYDAMSDDFNSAILIAKLFEATPLINLLHEKKESLDAESFDILKTSFKAFIEEILGLKPEEVSKANDKVDGLMELLLDLRKHARANKDFATSDKIRDHLLEIGFEIKDSKEGTNWNYR